MRRLNFSGRGWTLTRSNAESGVSAAIEQVLDGKALAADRGKVRIKMKIKTTRPKPADRNRLALNQRTETRKNVRRDFLSRRHRRPRPSRLRRRSCRLSNGFTIRHEHRQVIGDATRLYFSIDDSSFTDVPTADITALSRI